MKESELRREAYELLSEVIENCDQQYILEGIDRYIKSAKKRGLIEQTPLDKWDDNYGKNYTHTPDVTEATISANEMRNEMRNYILSELSKAKVEKRIGCGNEYRSRYGPINKCGYIDHEGKKMDICDDCIKRMMENKNIGVIYAHD